MSESITVITLLLSALDRIDLQAAFVTTWLGHTEHPCKAHVRDIQCGETGSFFIWDKRQEGGANTHD